MSTNGFWADLRSVLMPEKKWYYVFHLLVIAAASVYWTGSLIKLGSGSFPEIILYRPNGDTEYCPIITSLSKFNFGDPTDAFKYGQGIASFPIVDSLPHALACAVFGNAGYWVGDVVVCWGYFVIATLFFRRCNLGVLSSFWVSSALASNALQTLMGYVSGWFTSFLQGFHVQVWENGFPDLVGLPLFVQRIPRPMGTEPLALLTLYFLIKLWRERNSPDFKNGLVIGALMGLLAETDFYMTTAFGLVLAAIILRDVIVNRGRLPWLFAAGSCFGAAATFWYFIVQRLTENPDIPRRYGLASYPRSHLLFLPGYASLLRVAIIGVLAGVIFFLCRPRKVEPGKGKQQDRRGGKYRAPVVHNSHTVEKSIATFFVALLVAAWFAQPFQVFVLGKATQIYHFLFNVPILYGYAAIVLLFNIFGLTYLPRFGEWLGRFATQEKALSVVLVVVILSAQSVIAAQQPLDRINDQKTPRGAAASNEPWAVFGNSYRPNLRALQKEFVENPQLKATKTFSTLDFDVYVLLTAFDGKRAFNPDPFTSTLGDAEIENRLCELGKIFRLQPESFGQFIQMYYVDCYLLGHNKYRFATDHKFSSDDDYPPQAIAALGHMPKQWGWILLIPNSEVQRLVEKYAAILSQKSDTQLYPDMIVLTGVENRMGLVPSPEIYRKVYTNQVFLVYVKKQNGNHPAKALHPSSAPSTGRPAH